MAKRSPNGALSHLQSEILNNLADTLDDEVKTECRNTEEMMAALEQTDNLENAKKLNSVDLTPKKEVGFLNKVKTRCWEYAFIGHSPNCCCYKLSRMPLLLPEHEKA